MAQIKKVILKDTMSGDQLFPATSIDSLYNTDGTKWTPPTIPSPLNADQLQGHEASYFGTATQYTELSSKYDQLFQSVSNGKSLIASAITGKGVSTASDATFQQMATNIGSIQTGHQVYAIEAINCTSSSLRWNNPTGKTSFNDLTIYGWVYKKNDDPVLIWGDLYPSSSGAGYNAWNWKIDSNYIDVSLRRGQGDFNSNSNSLHKLVLVVK